MLIKPLRMGSPVIPFLLLTLSIAVWVEMDLFVPSLPEIMRYFSTTEQIIQMTFSFNFFGFFISSLFCGALSDALGRRVVLLGGTALFVMGSVLTISAQSIEWFLLGRLIQGIGVSGPAVVVIAVLADLYEGPLFIRWLSVLNCMVTTTMALAPICGAYLAKHFGWRFNFIVIAAMAFFGFMLVFFWVPETLPKDKRKQFKMRFLVSNYKKLLMSRKFVNPMVGLCFLVSPYFIFVGIISLLFMNELQIPLESYVFYQGVIVGVFALGSLIVSLFGEHLNLDRLMKVSMWLCVIPAACLLVYGLFLPDDALILTVLMAILTAGMVVPCTVLYMRATEVFPDLQASSSALFQSVRMLMLSIGTAVAGYFYNGFYAPIGLITAASIFFGAILVLPVLKEKTHAKNASRVAQGAH